MSMNQEIEKTRPGIIQFLGGVEIFEKYEKSKSSEEKIEIVYNSSVMQALFKKQREMLKKSNESLKNDKESKRLRDLGNNAFKKLRDRKALELYTEAAVFADQVGQGLL